MQVQAKRELVLSTRYLFIEERKGGLWCLKFEPQTHKNICANLRGPSKGPICHSNPSSPTGQGKSYRTDLSGEPHRAEICIHRCESKPFLQGCHAKKHSMRCTKSHVLDRKASSPAVSMLTSIRPITFLQHILRTLTHIRDNTNTKASLIDKRIRLTATSCPAPREVDWWQTNSVAVTVLGCWLKHAQFL